jgi:hypothetical protein
MAAFAQVFPDQDLPDIIWASWDNDEVMKDEPQSEKESTLAYYTAQRQRIVINIQSMFDIMANVHQVLQSWSTDAARADRAMMLLATSLQLLKKSATHEREHHQQSLHDPEVFEEMIAVNTALSEDVTPENLANYYGNVGEISATKKSLSTLNEESKRIQRILEKSDLEAFIKKLYVKMYRVTESLALQLDAEVKEREAQRRKRLG